MEKTNVKERDTINVNDNDCNNLASFLYNPLINGKDEDDISVLRRVLSCLSGCAIKVPGKC